MTMSYNNNWLQQHISSAVFYNTARAKTYNYDYFATTFSLNNILQLQFLERVSSCNNNILQP
jgi:hypothetical protein